MGHFVCQTIKNENPALYQELFNEWLNIYNEEGSKISKYVKTSAFEGFCRSLLFFSY